MLIHRDDMKDRRRIINVNHLQEAYKFLTQIRAYKVASIQICREILPHPINILSVVPKKPSIAHLYAVINPVDAFYEILIKPYNFHDHAAPGRAPYIFARHLRQIFPPVA